MLSRKCIAFVIALTVAISVLSTSPAAEVAAPKAENERKLRVSSFQGNPLAVTGVRNLQSQTWYKDVEIEVKNVSEKPIYCILAQLTFPDHYLSRSKVALLSLKFGLTKYLDIRVAGNPLDPHLKPGETCVLKIDEHYWDILRQREKRFPERLRSFVMSVGLISFGDKTGFTSEKGWADYRVKKHRALHHRELSLPASHRK